MTQDDRTIDLDALRVARWETIGEGPTVTHGGRRWRLVPELPLQIGWALGNNELQTAARFLLADPDEAEAFLNAAPIVLADLMELIRASYGVSAGEASASPGSSTNGGNRSRPTSPRSTTLTSAPSG